MDVLSDLLAHGQARGAVFALTSIATDCGVSFGGRRQLAVHTLLQGCAWFERDGSELVQLRAGDLILVPVGQPYRVVPVPGAAVRENVLDHRGLDLQPVSQAPAARLLCGAYTMRGPLKDLLLAALPALVPISSTLGDRRLSLTLSLIAEELSDLHPGSRLLLDRALDVLLALSLRAWFAAPGSSVPGWFAALEDPVAGPAMSAIHEHPEHSWTVEELATLASVSRAAFARRFATVVGTTPIAYLTSWRLTIAAQLLTDEPRATLAVIAERVGYVSEYAFAVAFRRQFGEPPGRWRRRGNPAV